MPMQTRIGAFKNGKIILQFNSLKEVEAHGWNITKVTDCCKGKKKRYNGMQWLYLKKAKQPTIQEISHNKEEEEETMKRIQEVTGFKRIDLDNIKVTFPVKLLQWQINNLLYNYNNKYAFPHTMHNLIQELIDIVKKSNIQEEQEKHSKEILQKARTLYKCLHTYIHTQDEQEKAIDDTARYILYTYSKKKNVMTVTQQLDMLTEIKGLLQYISTNNIQPTERISNLSKLSQQLKDTIVAQL